MTQFTAQRNPRKDRMPGQYYCEKPRDIKKFMRYDNSSPRGIVVWLMISSLNYYPPLTEMPIVLHALPDGGGARSGTEPGGGWNHDAMINEALIYMATGGMFGKIQRPQKEK